MKSQQKRFALLRIAFGAVWAIDAFFKWQPAFIGGFTSYFTSMLAGQPTPVQAWINFWLNIVNVNPHFFAILVASIETIIALGLIFGLFTEIITAGGIILTLLIWSTVGGFGGPYMSGATDIGTAIIYVFVFIALWLGESSAMYSIDSLLHKKNTTFTESDPLENTARDKKNLIIKILLITVVALGFTIVGFYFPTQLQSLSSAGQNSAGMGAMPAGMTLATYNLQPSDPIPTVDFDVAKDPIGGGWNLHIISTNFIFTPENENKAPIADQGHSHLYIDGVLYVVYGPWYHFGDLTPGEHTIAVSLNANDHSVFAVNGAYIKKEKTITQ